MALSMKISIDFVLNVIHTYVIFLYVYVYMCYLNLAFGLVDKFIIEQD